PFLKEGKEKRSEVVRLGRFAGGGGIGLSLPDLFDISQQKVGRWPGYSLIFQNSSQPLWFQNQSLVQTRKQRNKGEKCNGQEGLSNSNLHGSTFFLSFLGVKILNGVGSGDI
ncbi:hypothetical protein PanWU01x14_258410, partial [Parasponia andersonii]